jgi:hypothetical protein
MAIKSKAQIQAESNSTYVDNSVGSITPNSVRGLNTNWIDSIIFVEATASLNVFSATSASFATSASRADSAATASFLTGTVASASFAIQADTASFVSGNVASASFATSASRAISAATATSASYSLTSSLAQRNLITASAAANILTFTKGDGTTFSVSIAQSGSVQSASFADTANQANSASLAQNSLLLQGTGSNGFVTTASFATTSGSLSTRVTSLESFSSSLNSTFATDAELNAATQSLSASISTVNSNLTVVSSSLLATSASLLQVSASYIALSASYNISSGSESARITNLESFSSSLDATFATDAQLNAATQSLSASTSTVNTRVTEVSGSLLQVSASYVALSGSYNTASGSLSTRVTNNETTGSNLVAASSSFSSRVSNTEVTGSNLVNASASFSTRVSDNTANIQTLTSATASYAVLANNQTFTGTNQFNNAVTMSNVRVTGTASIAFLDVTFQSSSIIYSSGSNQLGDAPNDTQTLWGTVDIISGPLVVTGSANFKETITGSISNALTSTTASLATTNLLTASVAANILTFTKGDGSTFDVSIAQSGSITSASYADTANFANSATSASYAFTASSATNAGNSISASYAFTASSAVNATNALTASSADVFVVRTNLTASGLNYPSTDGLVDQFLTTDGTGNLSFSNLDTILEDVVAGENITKGDPLYISGSSGAKPIVYKADAAVASKMPVVYVAYETVSTLANTRGIVLGLIEGVNLTGYAAGDEIYVAEGGGWTSTRPTGSNSTVQFLGVVTKEGVGGKGLVLNPGPATLPNLQSGYAWVGDANNQPVAVATSSFVGGASAFPFTGSARITGSLDVIGRLYVPSGSFEITGSATINSGSLIMYSYKNTTPAARPFIAMVTQSLNSTNNIISISQTTAQSGSIVISGSGNYVSLTGVQTNLSFANGATSGFNGQNAYVTNLPITSGSNPLVNTTADRNNRFVPTLVNSNINGSLTVTDNRQTESSSPVNFSSVNQIGSITVRIDSGSLTTSQTLIGGLANVLEITGSGTTAISNSTLSNSILIGNGNNIIYRATGSQTTGINQSIIQGNSNRILITGSSSLNSTTVTNPILNNSLIVGQTLIVTGSTNTANGMTLLGNFNTADGLLNDPRFTTFAVGTGTSAAARGTAFHVSASGMTTANVGLNVRGVQTGETELEVRATGVKIGNLLTDSHNLTGSFSITGSQTITGSLVAETISGSFSGSGADIFGVVSSSLATENLITASAAANILTFTKGDGSTFDVTIAQSGSVVSASYADTANFANSATSASFASTASFLLGSVESASYAFTASSAVNATNALTASSVNDLNQTVTITGSLDVNGGITGSLLGNASTADLATTASFALTASFFAGSVTSASFAQTSVTASFATNFVNSGSYVITGSHRGNVVSQSIASSTASFDFSTGNFFTLNLTGSTLTHISASNIQAGQTVNVRITQGATTGSVSFSPVFKQVSGSAYVPTQVANAVDVVTFITFDNTNVYVSNIKNLV